MINSVLSRRPITRQPGGPLDKPLGQIAARLKVSPDQVLMAWAKSKGVVVVTCVLVSLHYTSKGLNFAHRTSSKESRLKGYLEAADLTLTTKDITDIDTEGAAGARSLNLRSIVNRVAVVMLMGAALFSIGAWRGVDLF